MDAIVEIEPNLHLIINVKWQTLHIKQAYKAVVSASSKTDKKYFGITETAFKVLETTQETSATKSTLTTLNFLNTCGN